VKKFIIALVLLFAPASYSAETPDMEKLGKAMKLNCKTFGPESCSSRFIAMSACTFAYGIAKSDKTVKESLDIADDLFVLLMRGNGLNPNNIFDNQNLIKGSIRSETIERVDKCKEWTKEAIPKIVLERTGKEATPEFIEGATRTFGMWWLNSLEGVKRGKYK
tara:strand:- start:373 stop:861 length:489 start_codon:yes stop_codon:yes gene_type:complete